MTLCAKLREAVAFFEQPPMTRSVPRLAPPDIPIDRLMREAADEIARLTRDLASARAENERLRSILEALQKNAAEWAGVRIEMQTENGRLRAAERSAFKAGFWEWFNAQNDAEAKAFEADEQRAWGEYRACEQHGREEEK